MINMNAKQETALLKKINLDLKNAGQPLQTELTVEQKEAATEELVNQAIEEVKHPPIPAGSVTVSKTVLISDLIAKSALHPELTKLNFLLAGSNSLRKGDIIEFGTIDSLEEEDFNGNIYYTIKSQITRNGKTFSRNIATSNFSRLDSDKVIINPDFNVGVVELAEMLSNRKIRVSETLTIRVNTFDPKTRERQPDKTDSKTVPVFELMAL